MECRSPAALLGRCVELLLQGFAYARIRRRCAGHPAQQPEQEVPGAGAQQRDGAAGGNVLDDGAGVGDKVGDTVRSAEGVAGINEMVGVGFALHGARFIGADVEMAVDLLGVYGDDLYRYRAIGTEAMGRGGFPDASGPDDTKKRSRVNRH